MYAPNNRSPKIQEANIDEIDKKKSGDINTPLLTMDRQPDRRSIRK